MFALMHVMSTNWSLAGNTSWDGQTCPVPISALDFIHDLTLPDIENIWPCEVRFYWLKIQPFVKVVRFLLAYVSAFIIVLGVTLNTASFCLLHTSVLNDSNLSLYLRVLSISDNGALIFNYAVGIARSHSDYVNGLFANSRFLCRTSIVMSEFFQFSSTWLVVCLTSARLGAVIAPLRSRRACHDKSATITIITLFCVIFTVSLTKLYFGGYESDSAFEYTPCDQKSAPWGSAMYFYIALSTWLPLFFVSFGNVLLIIQVRKSSKIRVQLSGMATTTREANVTQHTSRTLLAVSIVYLFLLLPLGVVETLELYWDVILVKEPATDTEGRSQYVNWLEEKMLLKWCRGLFFHVYHWNFAINFFLYCLTGKKFRSGVTKVFMHYKTSFCWKGMFNWAGMLLQKSSISISTRTTNVSLMRVIHLEERPAS